MTSTMQSRVDIGQFDGNGGLVQAENFVAAVDNALVMTKMDDARMAAMVKSAIPAKSPARVWLEIQTRKQVAGLDKWSEFRVIFQARWCRKLAVVQLVEMEEGLKQKAGEPVEFMYERCERYVMEDNADLTTEELAQSGAQKMYNTQVKKLFLKNLKREVREALTIQTKTASADEVKEAAMAVEAAKLKQSGYGTEAASFMGQATGIKSEMAEIIADLVEQELAKRSDQAEVDAMGGGSFKRGRQPQFQKGQGQANNQKTENNGREKRKCRWCGKFGYHKPTECYENPDNGKKNKGIGEVGHDDHEEGIAFQLFEEPPALN